MAEKRSSGKTAKRGGKTPQRGKAHIEEQRDSEIAGVLLIAAGVALGAYMIFSATGYLGELTNNFLFGLFGVATYAVPFVLLGLGILSIRGGRNARAQGSAWFAALGVLALIALMQLVRGVPYEGARYMDYINEAFTIGTDAHLGGGFVGAALCFPIQQLGGNVLAYTLLIAILLIAIIAVTGLSLRKVSERVGEGLDVIAENMQTTREEHAVERAERSERKLFTLDLDAEEEPPAARRKGKQADKSKAKSAGKKPDGDADDPLSFLPTEGNLHTKSGGKAAAKRPVPVVSDIWDDMEPGADVPLILTPAGNVPAPGEAPLPDAAALFGAQPTDKPVKTRKKKDEPAPAEAIDAPEIPVGEPPVYTPPSFELLNVAADAYGGTENTRAKAQLLLETLADFHVQAKVVDISVGPVLTRFELEPAPGVRVNRITALSNDIALRLAAPRVRIEAPIPGKSAVGIEIPNKNTVMVVLRDIVESAEFQTAKSPITFALGKDISGKIVVADLDKMPHMLIAGATGSGKSVCINDIIISMLYKSSPAELKLVLIDPKMVELSVYGSIPHLLIPVVTEPKKAASALRWAVNEMMQRYQKFVGCGTRDIARYNEVQTDPAMRLPKIVVIIDELADLMLVASNDVEDSICRIAQMGRAAGVHLIIATQRPSVDVITGLIKANVPSRSAFAVSSATDSRIILDASGAEKLLGRGDMLFHPNGAGKPTRLQCAFVSDEEVERVVDHFRRSSVAPAFDESIISELQTEATGGPKGGEFGEGKQEDELLGAAVRVALENGQASISMIQRRLRVGYARAARLVDMMEQAGYVSKSEGSKSRKVFIKPAEYQAIFGDDTPLAEPPENGGAE